MLRLSATSIRCLDNQRDMTDEPFDGNVHYKPLLMITAYKNMGVDIQDYPNAYAMYQNEITLPLHTKLTDEHVEYVITCFLEIVKCC